MKLTSVLRDGVGVLAIEGTDSLDSTCAAAFKREAVATLRPGTDTVVDLSAVEFVDSAGVGAFVGLYKAARACGCRVRFAAARPGVHAVLDLIRLDRILELSPDVPSAAEVLRARRRAESGAPRVTR